MISRGVSRLNWAPVMPKDGCFFQSVLSAMLRWTYVSRSRVYIISTRMCFFFQVWKKKIEKNYYLTLKKNVLMFAVCWCLVGELYWYKSRRFSIANIRIRASQQMYNPLMPNGAFNNCCPRDCVSRHNGGTSGAPLNPSESIVLSEHYRLRGV